MSKRVREINPFRIFVDGENCDPYRLAAMFDSLNGYEIQKIDKVVVYYDELNSSKAWLQLKFFTYNVEVDTIAVERIKEDKSLVDHKLLPVFQKQYIRMMWILLFLLQVILTFGLLSRMWKQIILYFLKRQNVVLTSNHFFGITLFSIAILISL